MDSTYDLLDSGGGQKLERFGAFTLARPCSQALWLTQKPRALWDQADAHFSRESERTGWVFRKGFPKEWEIELQGVKLRLAPTDFGHVGVFPEHSNLWRPMQQMLKARSSPQVLNLFAYSGGATLAAAQAGAKVCHVDASKGMVSWARGNAALNQLQNAPIRWIVDDALKFLQREVKRGVRYDGIILDPPSFGRGSQQEVFKIDRSIHPLLDLCQQLLTPEPLFLIVTTHTPGMTPLVMEHLLQQKLSKRHGHLETGEMQLPARSSFPVPCGSYAWWRGE